MPPLDMALEDGRQLRGTRVKRAEVMDVSGHTVGHIAFHYPDAKAVFTADSLMALGCGRIFEGTPEMMWDSLERSSPRARRTTRSSIRAMNTRHRTRLCATIEPDNAPLKPAKPDHRCTRSMREDGDKSVFPRLADPFAKIRFWTPRELQG